MRKSIKAIAAVTAALTMAISYVPAVFAVEEVPAASTETEKKTGVTFEEGKTFGIPYNGVTCITADDGTVIYKGYDNTIGNVYFFSLDENGKVDKLCKFSRYINDKGESIGIMNEKFKQCGEYFYLIYSECYGFSMRETVIVKLDRDLNEVERYRAPKNENIDTNGEKIVYMKGNRKIYSTDMDGSNKKLLFTLGDEASREVLNFITVSGDYVGFQKVTGADAPKDCKDYCGFINLKTGEVTFKEQRSVQKLYESNGKIIWYSSEIRDMRDSYMIEVPTGENIGAYASQYTQNKCVRFKDGEAYILDGDEFYTLKTQSPREVFDLTVDDDGNVITQTYDSKSGNTVFKIYRDNKLLGKYSVDVDGFCYFTADNGVITYCYTGLEPSTSTSDWVKIDPNMSDAEIEELLASRPKTEYNMKAGTIKYSVE